MKIINHKIIIFLFLNTILTSCCFQTRVRSYIIAEEEHSLITIPKKTEITKENTLNLD